MKCVVRDQHMLYALKNINCKKRQKLFLKTCDDRVIQTLSEIIHNTLKGNIKLEPHTFTLAFTQLKKFKTKLKTIHSQLKKRKGTKQRRRIFINQVGGFWVPLLTAVLSTLGEYGIKKLLG